MSGLPQEHGQAIMRMGYTEEQTKALQIATQKTWQKAVEKLAAAGGYNWQVSLPARLQLLLDSAFSADGASSSTDVRQPRPYGRRPICIHGCASNELRDVDAQPLRRRHAEAPDDDDGKPGREYKPRSLPHHPAAVRLHRMCAFARSTTNVCALRYYLTTYLVHALEDGWLGCGPVSSTLSTLSLEAVAS